MLGDNRQQTTKKSTGKKSGNQDWDKAEANWPGHNVKGRVEGPFTHSLHVEAITPFCRCCSGPPLINSADLLQVTHHNLTSTVPCVPCGRAIHDRRPVPNELGPACQLVLSAPPVSTATIHPTLVVTLTLTPALALALALTLAQTLSGSRRL